jgi:DNA-binding NarL/FixJ family response regulator
MNTEKTKDYVLAVGADPSLLRNDRDALRSAGERNVRVRLSGASGLETAREARPGLVVCAFDMGDMHAPEFIRALRASAAPPVLAISADRSRRAVLDCIAAGCSGYLLRPYTLDSFSRQLARVKSGVRLKAEFHERIEKLRAEEERERLLEEEKKKERPETYYRLGCRHLSRRRWDEAILAFTRAISLQSLYAEAYVGLAKAWKAKGRPDKFAAYMSKAAQAYAALEKYHEAREVFSGVLRDNPGAENPFLEIGFKLIVRGDYENAAKTYHQAESFKAGTNVYRELARACHFTGDPRGAARGVAEALAGMPGRPEASGIFERIMGGPWRPKRTESNEPREPRFPVPDRLHELWLVVKFTWQVYRNGGPLAAS